MSKKFAEHSQLNLSQVNKDVLKKWDENDVFAKSMTEREGCPSFVFYEGPRVQLYLAQNFEFLHIIS